MKIEKYITDALLPIVLCLFIAFKSTDLSYTYPDFVHEIYDEPLYKLLLLVGIIFVTQKHFTLGLLLMIVTVFILSDYHMLSEGFSGPNLNNCDIYNKDKINYVGTAFYPLNGENNPEEKDTKEVEPNSNDVQLSEFN
tara:strand:+ start:74 stop:487 length:414 start_codon:yes stop_codon:yes gene_type:complete